VIRAAADRPVRLRPGGALALRRALSLVAHPIVEPAEQAPVLLRGRSAGEREKGRARAGRRARGPGTPGTGEGPGTGTETGRDGGQPAGRSEGRASTRDGGGGTDLSRGRRGGAAGCGARGKALCAVGLHVCPVDRMPEPGDPCPRFIAEPGRCWQMVYSHQLQATHCTESPFVDRALVLAAW
jgi:hypothetical protein